MHRWVLSFPQSFIVKCPWNTSVHYSSAFRGCVWEYLNAHHSAHWVQRALGRTRKSPSPPACVHFSCQFTMRQSSARSWFESHYPWMPHALSARFIENVFLIPLEYSTLMVWVMGTERHKWHGFAPWASAAPCWHTVLWQAEEDVLSDP